MTTPVLITDDKQAERKACEGQLVRRLRGERSYREFKNYINEKIPNGMPGFTTFQSVWNWENNVHPVTGECLMAWMAFYEPEDPRYQLAFDIVALRKASFNAHWVGSKDEGDKGLGDDEGEQS